MKSSSTDCCRANHLPRSNNRGPIRRLFDGRTGLVRPDRILPRAKERTVRRNMADPFWVAHRNQHRDETAITLAEKIRSLNFEMPHKHNNILGMLLNRR
jgi:hypothetical protein